MLCGFISKFICKIADWGWPYVIYINNLGNDMKENPMVDHRKPAKSITHPISSKFTQKLDENPISLSFEQKSGT